MEQITIPLIKDNKRNRWIATLVVVALTTTFGYAVRVLHEIDQSSQRTESKVQAIVDARQNRAEHLRDIEARIDNLALMIVAEGLHEKRD